MGRVLVVDGNNAVSRGANAYPKAENPDGFPIGGLYGLVKYVRRFLADHDDHDSVAVVVDRGVPDFRKRICPEYKAQREADRRKDPEVERIYAAYKRQVKHVGHIARACGFAYARASGWEGDDLIGALALCRFRDRGVTIMSSDNDFIEIADGDRVRLYNPMKACYAEPNPTYLFERLLDPKASDNLDGVPGIGPAKAAILVGAWRDMWPEMRKNQPFKAKDRIDLGEFIGWCEYAAGCPVSKDKSEAKVQKLASMVVARQDKVVANYKVACIRRIAARCDAEIRLDVPGSFSRSEFKSVMRDYGMLPLLQDLSAYAPAFDRLDHSWMSATPPASAAAG